MSNEREESVLKKIEHLRIALRNSQKELYDIRERKKAEAIKEMENSVVYKKYFCVKEENYLSDARYSVSSAEYQKLCLEGYDQFYIYYNHSDNWNLKLEDEFNIKLGTDLEQNLKDSLGELEKLRRGLQIKQMKYRNVYKFLEQIVKDIEQAKTGEVK